MSARGFAARLLLLAAFPTAQVEARARGPELPQIAQPHADLLLHGNGTASAALKSSSADTFYLYGGPGSVLGKFQTQLYHRGSAGYVDQHGWTHRDATDQPPRWQRSTFNSPTGSMAMWAGRSAEQEPGWATPPGYGNCWESWLEFRRQVANPAQGQTVQLSFVFNHESEPGYDFFFVEYDSAGTVIPIFRLDGSNKDNSGIFAPLRFPQDVAPTHTLEYEGGSYAGDAHDEIVLRLVIESDCAWSDEDGLWPSDGFAQVDDITVVHADGIDFEDFEDEESLWRARKAPFAGDFSKVFERATDIDPCAENYTPLIGFLDDGTPASNEGGLLWNGDPIPSIGTTSVNWNYGIPGGWVLNYNGGVSFGQLSLSNEWWSPEIEWDLPGTADDDAAVAGAFLRFSEWTHLTGFANYTGIYSQWAVRSRHATTGAWSAWDNWNWQSCCFPPRWWNWTYEIGELLGPRPIDRVQVLLAVRDVAALFGYPGTDATIAPMYDNVSVAKYRLQGPTFATRTIDIFGDSFSQSGQADVSTQSARDLLDCRVDMNRSVTSGSLIIPGDSMICDIQSVIPGVAISDSLQQIRLHYSLSMNPFFEPAIRGNAPRTHTGGGRFGWDRHVGSVAPYQSTTRIGAEIRNRYAFDLPDEDFMYPGDVLEYYLEAVDDDGRTSTLPYDLSGFGDGSGSYNRTWTIRGLPTYFDDDGSHPPVLWWNDFGHRGGENEWLLAFAQNGLVEGVHFDTYTTKGPSSVVDNGLGSAGAHGATAPQMAGYRYVFYESGDLSGGLISDGTDTPGPGGNTNDKGNDVGLLTTWFQDPGADRFVAHFGDNVASYLSSGSGAQIGYLNQVMGVECNDANVRNEIDDQKAPHVLPSKAAPSFQTDFVADGSCPAINNFDSILPRPGAITSHGFELAGSPGNVYAGNSAGVVWDRADTHGNRRVSVSFPYGFHYVSGVLKSGESARSLLLGEILALFGAPTGGPPTTAPPARPSLLLHSPAPNPFNPKTTLRFELGRPARGDVLIYNLRGELVRTLVARSEFPAGANELHWNGRDDRDAYVASGVYLVRYRIDGFERQQKLVLLK